MFTKENSLILSGIVCEISLISALIFFQMSLVVVVPAFSCMEALKVYLLKKRFSLKKETNFNYFKKIQEQEQEIAQLKNEIQLLKSPKQD